MRQLTFDDLLDLMEEAFADIEAQQEREAASAIEVEADQQRFSSCPDSTDSRSLYAIMYDQLLKASATRFPTEAELRTLHLASILPSR